LSPKIKGTHSGRQGQRQRNILDMNQLLVVNLGSFFRVFKRKFKRKKEY
jgi:hypothetical protein